MALPPTSPTQPDRIKGRPLPEGREANRYLHLVCASTPWRRSSNGNRVQAVLDPLWRHLPGLRRLHLGPCASRPSPKLGCLRAHPRFDSPRRRRPHPPAVETRSPRCARSPTSCDPPPARQSKPVVHTKCDQHRKAAPPPVLAPQPPGMLTRRTAQRPRWPKGLTSSKTANGTTELIPDRLRHRTGSLLSRRAPAAERRGQESAGWSRSPASSCLEEQDASYRESGCCRPPCVNAWGGSFRLFGWQQVSASTCDPSRSIASVPRPCAVCLESSLHRGQRGRHGQGSFELESLIVNH